MSSRNIKISKKNEKYLIHMQRFNFFSLVVKRSQFIFELIKACVEKLLKFHNDFKVKYGASVRAGVTAARKLSRINLIQLWQFDVTRVLIFILIFRPFEQSPISWPAGLPVRRLTFPVWVLRLLSVAKPLPQMLQWKGLFFNLSICDSWLRRCCCRLDSWMNARPHSGMWHL